MAIAISEVKTRLERISTVKAVIITFVAATVLAVFGSAYVYNPVESISNPPSQSPAGALKAECNKGWTDVSIVDNSPVLACEKGEWRVILTPDGKNFERAFKPDSPNADWETNPDKVGW